MKAFLLVVDAVLLLATVLMGIASIGANSENLSERCADMAFRFIVVLVILILAEMIFFQ